jgi:Holliday junction resolvase RusA-like endonuclease
MLEVDKKREATASIRGYFYQLDAALLEILNADLNDDVVIEGIEDFDRYTDEGVIYGQVKYYAEQNLTDSVLRDPLHKLFVHFRGLEEAQRAGRKYLLYGHFAEVKIDIGELSVERFKSVMEYRKEVKAADGAKIYEKKSLLDGTAAPDELIEAFCKNFSIKISTEFSEHRNMVIEAIRKNQDVSAFEAEGFHYPIALDYITTLATKKDHNDRKTTRRDLQEVLKGTQAVHNRWLLREKEVAEYAKHIKRLYFSPTNGAGIVRAFVIECDATTDRSVICDQLRAIGNNWSSAKKRRVQNSDRYAPFILLRGADEKLIMHVKNELFDTGTVLVDGFPYRGSPFRIDHVHSLQTQERQIEIRFVEDEIQLREVLEGVGRKLCHIYDFFLERPMTMAMPGQKGRMYSIPISSISTIKKII